MKFSESEHAGESSSCNFLVQYSELHKIWGLYLHFFFKKIESKVNPIATSRKGMLCLSSRKIGCH